MEKEPIKIAFIGTSCVGKTTLVDLLRGQHKGNEDVVFLEEQARLFFAQNTVSDRFSAVTQGKIQAIILQNEQIAHAKKPKIIFYDRSVLDAVVYTRSAGDKEGSENLLREVEFWLPTYKRFLLLDPKDIPYKTDDVRKEDEETRRKFHQAFVDFFEEKQIPFELVSGTIEERLARIAEILEEN